VDDIAEARGLGADVGDVDDIAEARGSAGTDVDVGDIVELAAAEARGFGADIVAGAEGVEGVGALEADGEFSLSDSSSLLFKVSFDLRFFRALFSSDCFARGRFLP
jgi:hypothetical protein